MFLASADSRAGTAASVGLDAAEQPGDVLDAGRSSGAAGRCRRRPCRRAGGGRSAARSGARSQNQNAATARSSAAGSPRADATGRLLGGERDHPRGDVDVGHLDRHALELREPAAELGALLDVAGGQVARSGEQAVALEQQPGDRVLAQHVGRSLGEDAEDGCAVEHVGRLRLAAARARRGRARDAVALRVHEYDDRRCRRRRRPRRAAPWSGRAGRRTSARRSCGRSAGRPRAGSPAARGGPGRAR